VNITVICESLGSGIYRKIDTDYTVFFSVCVGQLREEVILNVPVFITRFWERGL
jgi:hypothetical protein